MEHSHSNLSSSGPRFVRWAILLGIVVALNIFLVVTRSLILVEPQYQTFCPASSYIAPQTIKECTAIGGTWTGIAPGPAPSGATVPSGYCDVTSKCQKQYDTAHEQYALYAFIFAIAFGVLAIIIGVMPLGSAIVSAGLSYGGVLSFVIASVQYWGDAGNLLRFGISFIALAALIYLGIKRFHD
jgi:hypothetical protein